MNKKFLLISIIFLSISICNCLYPEPVKPTTIVDVPTAEVTEYSSYDLKFRLYGEGGVLSEMVFGVFKPINIGISWDVDKLIGSGTTIDTRPPAILFKAKVFQGGMTIPAIAIGYSGQGYGSYNNTDETDSIPDTEPDKYQNREKGVYLALTQEYFVPGLEITFGCNIYDFDKEGVYSFAGITYGIENKLVFLSEYDNIRMAPENRANLGLKLFVTDNVDVTITGRNLFRGPESERIAIINYRGKF
ncbi:MAG: hypothetical protein AB1349_08890 [Elusimicrobiota bacterium]